MAETESKHVFVSYVREDSDRVDQLCSVLEAAQIPYWRDRTSLAPGDAWKAQIRDAIRDGSLVFLACFSDNSRARDRSHMNEELTLAVEEYRKLPPGHTWLIPVRLDPGDVPEWDLGAGRTLSDLNYADLFGDAYLTQAAALATTIHRVMGDKHLGAESTLAAVEQATQADRSGLMKRLTKEMVVDPARRIELDDLISQEVQRVNATLNDADLFPVDRLPGTDDETIRSLVEQAQAMWRLVEPFCHSLQVAARWGEPDSVSPWASGIRTLVMNATRLRSGVEALLDLRHVPAVTAISTASLACTAAGRFDNLKRLVVDPSVQDGPSGQSVGLLDATDPYEPFGQAGLVPHVLARAAVEDEDVETALKHFSEKPGGKYYTPTAEWLHAILRPLFIEQIADNDLYDSEFDRAEVTLGLLSQDAANQRHAAQDVKWRARSRWFGRSTWRAARSRHSLLTDIEHQLQSDDVNWQPLRHGLFGSDVARAKGALESYTTDFNEIAKRRF